MSAAEDVRDYLVAQGLTGTVNVGTLTESPDAQVAVLAYGGSPPVLAMGQHNVIERITYLQVLVRGAKFGYEAAEAQAEAAFQLLRHALGVTVGGTFYDRIVVVGEPAQLVPDANERPRFVFNVEAWKRGS